MTGEGKVAVVTGGAVRVGRALSEGLATAGYRVAVNYRGSADSAVEVVDAIRSAGGDAIAVRADVTAAADVDSLVSTTFEAYGRIDLLVNNAAVFERRAFLDLDDEHWRRTLAVNLEAPLRVGLAVARRMWEAGSGRIVNICGTVGIHPAGDYTAYCVSKSGLDTLTRCMAEALAPRVQVNGVAPGAILFPDGTSEGERREVLARVPAGHVGCPDDVIAAVLFFAEAPDYITGTILPVDGGASLSKG